MSTYRTSVVKMSTALPAIEAGAPPVAVPIEITRELFEKPTNKYDLYEQLVDLDSELFGAIDSKATLVTKTIKGFTLRVGRQLNDSEKHLLQALQEAESVLLPYVYDIAYKLQVHGNAVYKIDSESDVGIRQLVYLPMQSLTCVARREQKGQFEKSKTEKIRSYTELVQLETLTIEKPQIMGRGLYILNEGAGTDLEQTFELTDVVHFDLGKQEIVYDTKGRLTFGVWNKSPIEPLKAKILWKHAILINDMLWRERNVPREHHIIKSSGMFSPDLFPGDSYAQKLQAAQTAAQNALASYKQTFLTKDGDYVWPRADKGYITFDDVEIIFVEPKIQYTQPNELLDQIDKSVYSVVAPESAVSGRSRATYAAETAIGMYTALKAERIAECIGRLLVKLAQKYIQLKYKGKYTQQSLDKIDAKYSKILERHLLVRDAAIMKETGFFLRDEIRELLDYGPPTAEQARELELMAQSAHKYTETTKEITPTSTQIAPRESITPQSKEQQQKT